MATVKLCEGASSLDLLELSDVLFVTLSVTGDVQFQIKPRQKSLSNTFVNFTQNNWASYLTVARPKILKALATGATLEEKYHANSKVVQVVYYNGAPQVHLMTFSAKGSARRELCVYLTRAEFNNLEKVLPELTNRIINTVDSSRVGFMRAYKWKVIPEEPGIVCEKLHYSADEARRDGHDLMRVKAGIWEPEMTIETDYIMKPDPLNFMKNVYSMMIALAVEHLDSDNFNPYEKGNVKEFYQAIKIHIKQAMRICTPEKVKYFFMDCWKFLGLDLAPIDSLLSDVFTMWDLPGSLDMLEIQVERVYRIYKGDAELSFLYNQLWDTDIMSWIMDDLNEHFPGWDKSRGTKIKMPSSTYGPPSSPPFSEEEMEAAMEQESGPSTSFGPSPPKMIKLARDSDSSDEEEEGTSEKGQATKSTQQAQDMPMLLDL